MIKTVHHAGVGVRDEKMLKEMLHFYCDLLGLQVDGEVEYPEGELVDKAVDVENANLKVIHLTPPGAESWWDGGVELCCYSSPEPKEWRGGTRQCDGGLIHLALVVEDLQGMYERLVKEGVTFNTEPLNLGTHVIVYMRDPDRNTVELMEYLRE